MFVWFPMNVHRGMQETKEILAGIEPGQSVGIFIGPEGGFEEKEIEAAIEGGAKPITLEGEFSAQRQQDLRFCLS